jgi:uncharacterized protein YbjQ (UPF0145 family)
VPEPTVAPEDRLTEAVPPSARARLRHTQATGLSTSQLTAGEQAALSGVGFTPVGQVMGASVWSLNQTGRGACAYPPSNRTRPAPRSAAVYAEPSSGAPAMVGRRRTQHMHAMGALVDAFTTARRSALRRLQAEAAALGADGVVGVELTLEPFVGSAQRSLSFVAIGTAVRAAGATHLAGPFLSDVNGDDLAVLLRSGWAPTGLVMGVGAVVAHDDYGTLQRRRSWRRNLEIPTYSDLATQARVDARARLNEDVRAHSGEAAVLGTATAHVWRQPCRNARTGWGGGSNEDHFVEVVMLGTAISRFPLPSGGEPTALPIMRLGQPVAPRARARQVVIDPFTHRRGN